MEQDIPIEKIKILENIRTRIEQSDLIGLMQTIKQDGLLQPIGVYKENDEYILAWGNRRLLACKKLGWRNIPAIVIDEKLPLTDFLTINTVENIHRKDINPIEFARICKMLLDNGLNVGEISARLSVTRSTIDKALQIYKKVPKRYESDIRYIPSGTGRNKRGKISSSVANSIVRIHLNQSDNDKLFDVAKDEELASGDIRIIGNLIIGGARIDDAIKIRKFYILKALELPVRINELELITKQYNLPFSEIIRKMIKGELPPDRVLLF